MKEKNNFNKIEPLIRKPIAKQKLHLLIHSFAHLHLILLVTFSMVSCSAVKLYPNNETTNRKPTKKVDPNIHTEGEVTIRAASNTDKIEKVDINEVDFKGSKIKFTVAKEFMGKTYQVAPFENTFNIALMLPFSTQIPYFERNVLGGIMMDYYEGVLTAVAELEKEGFKAKIRIYDTWNDSQRMIRLFGMKEMEKYNLVIGPIRKKGLKTAYQFSKRTGIPVVSPLQYYANASDTSLNFPFINMFAHDTSRAYNLGQEVARKYKNYKVVVMSSVEGELTEYHMRRNFRNGYASISKKYASTFVNTSGVMSQIGIFDSLIIYYPTNSRNKANMMISKVAGKNNIKVIGLSKWKKFKKINYKSWNNTFIFSDPFFIERNKPEIVDFRRKYRADYGGEPSRFVFIGYDQMRFLSKGMMALGPKFYEHISSSDFDMLCSRIHLVNKKGQFENSGVKLVEYNDMFLTEVK